MTVMISFGLFLLAFAAVGAAAVVKKKSEVDDYLVAGRGVHPVLTALSSVATNFSGYMFMGLIGFTYMFGLSALWLTLGWTVGDYMVWRFVHERVRRRSEAVGAVTVPALLGHDGNKSDHRLVKAAGLLTLVFLSVYGAAQLSAGSKALTVFFGWDHAVGAVLGAIVVLVYCFSGGIRASIWTDAVQAVVMIAAMILMLGYAVADVGGPAMLYGKLAAMDPALVDIVPDDLALGFGLYFLGWIAGGFGAVGAPHVLVRSMAIRDPSEIRRARRVYFAGYIPFSIAAVAVALYARVLIPDAAAFDPELAMPTLAGQLLPEVLVGIILAGIFASTMSTADSLILSCSAALTQDIAPRLGKGYIFAKAGTLFITIACLAIALWGPKSVLELVFIAWSGLAASLGPILLLRLYDVEVGGKTALLQMVVGLTTVIVWREVGLGASVFEILPGIAASFAVFGMSRLVGWLTGAAFESAEVA
ncbi:MAG: sodium/proline symporter [Deltaproteobacteria bacterium]